MSAAVVAFGAVSAMGEGWKGVSAGEPGARARVLVERDAELEKAGLARPHVARVDVPDGPRDRATSLILRAADVCVRDLDATLPGWRSQRIGLALGTSSGGMRTAERFFESRLDDRAVALGATYFAPMLDLVRALRVELEPATLVMGACAASTLAVGVGARWLDIGACDLVLAGGFDAVSVFVAAGFEALRATSASIPSRPFRAGRDGMALGEGAALLALVRSDAAQLSSTARVHITGFGASSDAVHLTAPDRTGTGLAVAATRALEEAEVARPDLVSPHGSATPFSDAAEAQALGRALGEAAGQTVVHPFKAQIGHTLGASGALELLACADALIRGIHPAAAGEGDVDPDARVLLLDVARQGTPRTALKLSAAFGGANAALVLSRDAHAGKAGAMPRAVYLGRAAHIAELPSPEALAARIAAPVERVLRADGIARWALAAVAALAERDGPLCPAGVIVGTPFATMETNALFHARITERGARMAEPRRFPYTSPNAAPGEVGVAFGLKGPSFAVGCGAHAAVEALVVAAQLVRGGDAEAIVVVAADDVGSHVSRAAEAMGVTPRSGGVAILVTADRGRAVAEVRSARCGFGSLPAVAQVTCGHLPLLPLVGALALPRELSVRSPDPIHEGADGWARVELAAI